MTVIETNAEHREYIEYLLGEPLEGGTMDDRIFLTRLTAKRCAEGARLFAAIDGVLATAARDERAKTLPNGKKPLTEAARAKVDKALTAYFEHKNTPCPVCRPLPVKVTK